METGTSLSSFSRDESSFYDDASDSDNTPLRRASTARARVPPRMSFVDGLFNDALSNEDDDRHRHSSSDDDDVGPTLVRSTTAPSRRRLTPKSPVEKRNALIGILGGAAVKNIRSNIRLKLKSPRQALSSRRQQTKPATQQGEPTRATPEPEVEASPANRADSLGDNSEEAETGGRFRVVVPDRARGESKGSAAGGSPQSSSGTSPSLAADAAAPPPPPPEPKVSPPPPRLDSRLANLQKSVRQASLVRIVRRMESKPLGMAVSQWRQAALLQLSHDAWIAQKQREEDAAAMKTTLDSLKHELDRSRHALRITSLRAILRRVDGRVLAAAWFEWRAQAVRRGLEEQLRARETRVTQNREAQEALLLDRTYGLQAGLEAAEKNKVRALRRASLRAVVLRLHRRRLAMAWTTLAFVAEKRTWAARMAAQASDLERARLRYKAKSDKLQAKLKARAEGEARAVAKALALGARRARSPDATEERDARLGMVLKWLARRSQRRLVVVAWRKWLTGMWRVVRAEDAHVHKTLAALKHEVAAQRELLLDQQALLEANSDAVAVATSSTSQQPQPPPQQQQGATATGTPGGKKGATKEKRRKRLKVTTAVVDVDATVVTATTNATVDANGVITLAEAQRFRAEAEQELAKFAAGRTRTGTLEKSQTSSRRKNRATRRRQPKQRSHGVSNGRVSPTSPRAQSRPHRPRPTLSGGVSKRRIIKVTSTSPSVSPRKDPTLDCMVMKSQHATAPTPKHVAATTLAGDSPEAELEQQLVQTQVRLKEQAGVVKRLRRAQRQAKAAAEVDKQKTLQKALEQAAELHSDAFASLLADLKLRHADALRRAQDESIAKAAEEAERLMASVPTYDAELKKLAAEHATLRAQLVCAEDEAKDLATQVRNHEAGADAARRSALAKTKLRWCVLNLAKRRETAAFRSWAAETSVAKHAAKEAGLAGQLGEMEAALRGTALRAVLRSQTHRVRGRAWSTWLADVTREARRADVARQRSDVATAAETKMERLRADAGVARACLKEHQDARRLASLQRIVVLCWNTSPLRLAWAGLKGRTLDARWATQLRGKQQEIAALASAGSESTKKLRERLFGNLVSRHGFRSRAAAWSIWKRRGVEHAWASRLSSLQSGAKADARRQLRQALLGRVLRGILSRARASAWRTWSRVTAAQRQGEKQAAALGALRLEHRERVLRRVCLRVEQLRASAAWQSWAIATRQHRWSQAVAEARAETLALAKRAVHKATGTAAHLQELHGQQLQLERRAARSAALRRWHGRVQCRARASAWALWRQAIQNARMADVMGEAEEMVTLVNDEQRRVQELEAQLQRQAQELERQRSELDMRTRKMACLEERVAHLRNLQLRRVLVLSRRRRVAGAWRVIKARSTKMKMPTTDTTSLRNIAHAASGCEGSMDETTTTPSSLSAEERAAIMLQKLVRTHRAKRRCHARRIFAVVDKNRNGTLDREELEEYLLVIFEDLYRANPRLRDSTKNDASALAYATASSCFDDADINSDGKIDWPEFKAWADSGDMSSKTLLGASMQHSHDEDGDGDSDSDSDSDSSSSASSSEDEGNMSPTSGLSLSSSRHDLRRTWRSAQDLLLDLGWTEQHVARRPARPWVRERLLQSVCLRHRNSLYAKAWRRLCVYVAHHRQLAKDAEARAAIVAEYDARIEAEVRNSIAAKRAYVAKLEAQSVKLQGQQTQTQTPSKSTSALHALVDKGERERRARRDAVLRGTCLRWRLRLCTKAWYTWVAARNVAVVADGITSAHAAQYRLSVLRRCCLRLRRFRVGVAWKRWQVDTVAAMAKDMQRSAAAVRQARLLAPSFKWQQLSVMLQMSKAEARANRLEVAMQEIQAQTKEASSSSSSSSHPILAEHAQATARLKKVLKEIEEAKVSGSASAGELQALAAELGEVKTKCARYKAKRNFLQQSIGAALLRIQAKRYQDAQTVLAACLVSSKGGRGHIGVQVLGMSGRENSKAAAKAEKVNFNSEETPSYTGTSGRYREKEEEKKEQQQQQQKVSDKRQARRVLKSLESGRDLLLARSREQQGHFREQHAPQRAMKSVSAAGHAARPTPRRAMPERGFSTSVLPTTAVARRHFSFQPSLSSFSDNEEATVQSDIPFVASGEEQDLEDDDVEEDEDEDEEDNAVKEKMEAMGKQVSSLRSELEELKRRGGRKKKRTKKSTLPRARTPSRTSTNTTIRGTPRRRS